MGPFSPLMLQVVSPPSTFPPWIAPTISAIGVIVSVIVAVVGWWATARNTFKNQKKQLHFQMLNEARRVVVEATREYQSWLSSCRIAVGLLQGQVDVEKAVPIAVNWSRTQNELKTKMYSGHSSSAWLMRLEEYEALFPEMRPIRLELFTPMRHIDEKLGDLAQAIGDETTRYTAIESRHVVGDLMDDMSALLEDICVYVQNRTFHEITGVRAPFRVPLDPDVPRIVQMEDGSLKIMPETRPWEPLPEVDWKAAKRKPEKSV